MHLILIKKCGKSLEIIFLAVRFQPMLFQDQGVDHKDFELSLVNRTGDYTVSG